jgi:hypothetical protein
LLRLLGWVWGRFGPYVDALTGSGASIHFHSSIRAY